MRATALLTASALLGAGCGGTLEGKYRRGELTSTTTTLRPPASTTPSSGNAAGQSAEGEPEGRKPDGTIVRSATRRAIDPSRGGRHR
jgi:hypothetical protein